jgi:Ca2+-binding EF-hand superfamily protein
MDRQKQPLPTVFGANGLIATNPAVRQVKYSGSYKWKGVGISATHVDEPRANTVVAFDHAHYANDESLTIKKMEDLFREKVMTNTRNDTVTRKDTWRAFVRSGGNKRAGLTLEQMRVRCQQWGIRPSEGLLRQAFRKWDEDGSGLIDFDEFCDIIIEKDYPEEAGLHRVVRGFASEKEATSSDIVLARIGAGVARRPNQKTMHQILNKGSVQKSHSTQMHIDDVIECVRKKIQSHSKGGNREMIETFRLFDRPKHGISKPAFKHKLNLWGLHVSDQQLGAVFGMIDTDGNGKISFAEFVSFFGQESNEHPLYFNYKKRVHTAGEGGNTKKEEEEHMEARMRRKLSFLPQRTIPEKQMFLSQTSAPKQMLTNGKSVTQTKEEDINTASFKYNNRRQRTTLRGDVVLFLKRLLQNAHYAVCNGEAHGATSAIQFAESQFPLKKPMKNAVFLQVVQQGFARPMRIQVWWSSIV